jgi:RNA polymerase sigma factor for flagellar operon FliA
MSSGPKHDRDELILQHYPMVRRVAYRMARRLPQCVDAEDLVNIGVIGLIDAVDRFEVGRAPSFTAYARIRVQGAIVDEMRKNDWVPRSVRDRARRISRVKTSLSEKLERDPTAAEIADELGVDKERLLELMKFANIRTLVSTEEGADREGRVGDTLKDTGESPADIVAREHLGSIVREVIGELPERERLIAELYYFRDRTFKEIAATLGVTESRVSQLHTRMKKRIRGLMTQRFEDGEPPE